MHFRTAQPHDLSALLTLHREVARAGEGLTCTESEVSEDFVKEFIEKSLAKGLIIVAENPENKEVLVGEIHATQQGSSFFAHVLSGLSLVVHPAFQSQGVGRALLMIFLDDVARTRPDIGKVELTVRESNSKAIALFQSLGFVIEGRMEMRIKTPTGNYEADIPMSWQNPTFEFDGSIPRLQ